MNYTLFASRGRTFCSTPFKFDSTIPFLNSCGSMYGPRSCQYYFSLKNRSLNRGPLVGSLLVLPGFSQGEHNTTCCCIISGGLLVLKCDIFDLPKHNWLFGLCTEVRSWWVHWLRYSKYQYSYGIAKFL